VECLKWSSVKRLRTKDEIHIGDRVQFWRAVPDGGMVAVGDIVNERPVRCHWNRNCSCPTTPPRDFLS
jgi:hypothetical protein